LLFEAGIFFSRIFIPSKAEEESSELGLATNQASSTPATGKDDPPRYIPMTEEEMEAELDAIEADEDDGEDDYLNDPTPSIDAIEDNLKHANELRLQGNEALARDLLYEVLRFGDDKQIEVARNILRQMDED